MQIIADVENRRGHPVQSGRLQHFETRSHAVNSRYVKNAGFVALSRLVEVHSLLSKELRRLDIPRSEQRRAAKLEIAPGDEDNSDRRWSKHPFVSVRAQEIHEACFKRESTKRLDGVDGKEDAAVLQEGADGIHVNTPTGEIVARREGN